MPKRENGKTDGDAFTVSLSIDGSVTISALTGELRLSREDAGALGELLVSVAGRRKRAATAPAKVAPPNPSNLLTWSAYATAYEARYGIAPVRNARTNGMIARFTELLPADVAPSVAAFYVRHGHGHYVSRCHPVDLMLRDAESLHAQWATGRLASQMGARQTDATQARASTAVEAADILRRRGSLL